MAFVRSLLAVAVAIAFVFVVVGVTNANAADNTSLAFQGFEKNTGDWTPITTRVPSGGGTLHVPSASGHFHAELTNVHDSYSAGYGGNEFSYFGFATTPAYPGNFSQSISMYVFANWAPAIYNGPGVWIDMSPGHPSGNYGAEHNFRLTPTGSAVRVYVDGQVVPIATITASGWYKFQMTYRKGATPTALVSTDMNVFNSRKALIGTTTVISDSPGGTLLSQDLKGPGYVWITVWANGWANDVLAIDDVRADLLAAADDCQQEGQHSGNCGGNGNDNHDNH